jgi:hypothetical protein
VSGALLYDIVFLSFFYLEKSWAKTLLKIKYVLSMIFVVIAYYTTKNYLRGSIDVLLFTSILVLLFAVKYTKFTRIVFVTYCTLFMILVSMQAFAIRSVYVQKQKVEKIVSPMEKTSEHGYRIVLPNSTWKFIPKEEQDKLEKGAFKNADIMVVKDDASCYGTFYPDNIENVEINEKYFKDFFANLKEIIFPDAVIVDTRSIEDGKLQVLRRQTQGLAYSYFHFIKVFKTIALQALFWTSTNNEQQLSADVEKFLDNISKVSLKELKKKKSPAQIYEENNDAVVMIRVYNDQGEVIGFGSGFNFYPVGVIATSLHVVLSEGSYMDVKFPTHGVYEEVYIVGLDTQSDLAVLRIKGKNLPTIKTMRSVEVEVGDKVFTISNPEGYVNTMSEGIVSAARIIDGELLYQISAPISQGSSGGAVFNEFGEVVGVVAATSITGQNLNFAVPVEELDTIKAFETSITLKEINEYLKTNSKN